MHSRPSRIQIVGQDTEIRGGRLAVVPCSIRAGQLRRTGRFARGRILRGKRAGVSRMTSYRTLDRRWRILPTDATILSYRDREEHRRTYEDFGGSPLRLVDLDSRNGQTSSSTGSSPSPGSVRSWCVSGGQSRSSGRAPVADRTGAAPCGVGRVDMRRCVFVQDLRRDLSPPSRPRALNS